MTASTRHPTVILPVPTYSRSSAPQRRGDFAPKGKKSPIPLPRQRSPSGWTLAITWFMAGGGNKQPQPHPSLLHPAPGMLFFRPVWSLISPPFVHRTQLQIPPRRFVGGRRLRPLHVRGTRIHLVPPSLRNPRRLEETLTPADPPNPRLNLCHKPRQCFSSEAPPK